MHGDPSQGIDPTGEYSLASVGTAMSIISIVLFNANYANAPGPGDRLYNDNGGGNLLWEVPSGFVGFGIGRWVLGPILRRAGGLFARMFFRSGSTSISQSVRHALLETGMDAIQLERYLDELGDVFLFRGTSNGFAGNASRNLSGITPVSLDPIVAAAFAAESRGIAGNGRIYLATMEDLATSIVAGSRGSLRLLEREVGVDLLPLEFARRAGGFIELDSALRFLRGMGINLPDTIPKGGVHDVLRSMPQMTPLQIKQFLVWAVSSG